MCILSFVAKYYISRTCKAIALWTFRLDLYCLYFLLIFETDTFEEFF